MSGLVALVGGNSTGWYTFWHAMWAVSDGALEMGIASREGEATEPRSRGGAVRVPAPPCA